MSIRKGVINLVDNNLSKMQTNQIEGIDGEVASEVERYQSFGMTTWPIPCDINGLGSECIIADLGSSSMRTVIAADDRRYRPVISHPGDVVFYSVHDTQTAIDHDHSTQRIAMTDDGTSGDHLQYRILLKNTNTSFQMRSDDAIILNNQHFSATILATGATTISNDHCTIVVAANGTVSVTAPTVNITGNVNITGDLTISGAVTNAGKNISKSHTHSGVTAGSGTTGQVS